MIAMMLEEFVDTLGHHVCGVAGTLEEARAIIRTGGFDLAILDCHIHGEEVWPIADMLEAEGIPYILSSGGSVSGIPDAYASRPMLPKPYTIATISDMLSESEYIPE